MFQKIKINSIKQRNNLYYQANNIIIYDLMNE